VQFLSTSEWKHEITHMFQSFVQPLSVRGYKYIKSVHEDWIANICTKIFSTHFSALFVCYSCVAIWTELEELVLSGNKLQNLPDNITCLKHLRVLRVHSNHLQTIPCFGKMKSLKVHTLSLRSSLRGTQNFTCL